jgi:hypothetical protein
MAYEHLRLGREAPLTERHPRRHPGVRPPTDPRVHGQRLHDRLEAFREQPAPDVGGFDDRRLLKIRLRAGEKAAPDLNVIPGVEIVSQEDETVVLAFASDQGLQEFESRLATLARDGVVTRKELLYVIEDFERWSPEDRTGHALREQGMPHADTFMLDVELWPQERQDRRRALLDSFFGWLTAQGLARLDSVDQPWLVLLRVRCNREQAEQLLNHRDVRTVDLPPRVGVSVELLLTDVNKLPQVEPPPADAPSIGVLDSGIAGSHPVLGAALGDAQGFLPPRRSPDDAEPWHGTFVSGLALYGDVKESIARGRFTPMLRLFSGKVFNHDGLDQTEFVEKAVEAAVRDLREQYGCRIFNFSYGDLNKVYDGRHLRGLAYTLDRLTRELGVLFVVPTGNLSREDLPDNPREGYPAYLAAEKCRLLDPATALNALTVGGLSLNEATHDAQRHPETIEDHILARASQPFPLTRRGPSINGAIKPEVVEDAGNVALMRTGFRLWHQGLGVVSLSGGFATGSAFREDIGTSCAAPQLAHKAARLLAELPDATPNLLRALIGAHARWPLACEALLNPQGNVEGRSELLNLIGYGKVDDSALHRSLDSVVSLLAEERVGHDSHHFFELPLPASFWAGGRRTREVAVALAYSPAVRTTRLEYRNTRLWFSLVSAVSLDEVTQAFRRNRAEGMGERSNGRWLPNDTRKCGTLQVSRWMFRQALTNNQKIFVVVTRQDAAWSDSRDSEEPYALAVVVGDRENANAALYADMRASLEARATARARARV